MRGDHVLYIDQIKFIYTFNNMFINQYIHNSNMYKGKD